MTASGPQWHAIVVTPIGGVGLALTQGRLSAIGLLGPHASAMPARQAPARAVQRQLAAYFQEPGYRFDLPLEAVGTTFQRRVWRAMREIPAGCVRTYGALAAELGSSARAVGGACRANPLPIVVPCHRVVAARGPGGFAGSRTGFNLQIKQWLLRHEAAARRACA